ncbi:hypothetical protein AAG747_18965 [Rapidithrix thailandica]|uniref:Uncharacterized protein n=1 Tax=Rapidithrix thailandica TaxID=413964 RepID=A0AAW9S810_9BACT
MENEIINNYGFNGVKLVFESRNSTNYYQLGEFPKGCPWVSLNDNPISKFIAGKIPNLISALKGRCEFIYTEKKESTWYLHDLLDMKLYDDRDYFKVYTGGVPLLNPEPNKNLKTFNWDIPTDLKTFYTIHNGFGEIYDANFVRANEDIKLMAEMMNPILIPPSVKNYTCKPFHKGNSNTTVDRDHEVWEISGEIASFEFTYERMSEIDEE